MKPFAEFKSEPIPDRYPQLPAGAYVAQIVAAKEDGVYPEDSIVLRLEIKEGEWAGYYARRYQHDQESSSGGRAAYAPRYKGDFIIRAPRAENPRLTNLEWAIRNFNNAIWAIEDSNEGFHFDFANIPALRGKLVGINVRNAVFQGTPYTEIGRLESARQVREGKVRPMKDREDRSGAASASSASAGGFSGGPTPVDIPTEELPF